MTERIQLANNEVNEVIVSRGKELARRWFGDTMRHVETTTVAQAHNYDATVFTYSSDRPRILALVPSIGRSLGSDLRATFFEAVDRFYGLKGHGAWKALKGEPMLLGAGSAEYANNVINKFLNESPFQDLLGGVAGQGQPWQAIKPDNDLVHKIERQAKRVLYGGRACRNADSKLDPGQDLLQLELEGGNILRLAHIIGRSAIAKEGWQARVMGYLADGIGSVGAALDKMQEAWLEPPLLMAETGLSSYDENDKNEIGSVGAALGRMQVVWLEPPLLMLETTSPSDEMDKNLPYPLYVFAELYNRISASSARLQSGRKGPFALADGPKGLRDLASACRDIDIDAGGSLLQELLKWGVPDYLWSVLPFLWDGFEDAAKTVLTIMYKQPNTSSMKTRRGPKEADYNKGRPPA